MLISPLWPLFSIPQKGATDFIFPLLRCSRTALVFVLWRAPLWLPANNCTKEPQPHWHSADLISTPEKQERLFESPKHLYKFNLHHHNVHQMIFKGPRHGLRPEGLSWADATSCVANLQRITLNNTGHRARLAAIWRFFCKLHQNREFIYRNI